MLKYEGPPQNDDIVMFCPTNYEICHLESRSILVCWKYAKYHFKNRSDLLTTLKCVLTTQSATSYF